jgi:AraC family transcriptional regulator
MGLVRATGALEIRLVKYERDNKMSAENVQIVRLEPARVASVLGFGSSPELEAIGKLVAWAKPKGYLENLAAHRVFGFNNPSPSPGSPNYGYELWMVVTEEVQPEGVVEIKAFPGGLYAVKKCVVAGDAYEIIPATWKQLVMWREDSPYRAASHQWLEEHLQVEFSEGEPWALDLYLPIEE